MDVTQNILYAKKHIVENIYSSVKVEGLAMTFPETSVIIENGKLNGKSFDDVSFVNDLKHAWDYLLSHIEETITLETVKNMNRLSGKFTVINAGSIRSIADEPIGVIGDNGEVVWQPELPPKRETIDKNIREIYTLPDKKDAAVNLYLYLARGQFFNDGNKRTAALICNMVLIQNGEGIFLIPPDKSLEFKKLLVNFYINDDDAELKQFINANCIKRPAEYTLGQKLQLIREKNNISREEMAEILNISPQEQYEYEKDIVIPEKEITKKFADYFDMDADTLMSE